MTKTLDKTDIDLKEDVLSELRYEPSVKVNEIGVTVKDGTVTLSGFTSTFGEKWDAVRAAKRVAGVNSIANDIEVKIPGSVVRTDSDIAHAAMQQIDWAPTIPTKAVTVMVSKGWLTLEGEVEWWYQRRAAESAVHYLAGVKGITNLITIKSVVTPENVEASIHSAFKRSAMLEADKIHVEAIGKMVKLTGKVRNYAEEEEAVRAAWAAPGVEEVDNQLKVNWFLL